MQRHLGPIAKFRRRGNPNWGKRLPPSSAPRLATEFEMQVKQLRLTRDRYVYSEELRDWCERNCNRCYVPEWLLKAWDIPVEVDIFSGAA